MMPKNRLLSLAILLLTAIKCVQCEKVELEISPEVVGADAAVVAKDSALMGKIFPLAAHFFVRKGGLTFRQVFRALADLVDEREFAVLALLGWGLVPFTLSIRELYLSFGGKGLDADGEESEVVVEETKKSNLGRAYEVMSSREYEASNRGKASSEVEESKDGSPFERTFLFQLVDHVSQAARIGLAVIVVDCVSLISRTMGYNPLNIMENMHRIFSKVAYSGWITLRLQRFKRYLLERSLGRRKGSDLGKLKLLDWLADGAFHLVWILYILNSLEVETGIAVKSLIGLGATGTLVFGLACKDIAGQIMSGVTLHLSEKMFEGDEVRFSDGTSGIIGKMGWFETMIRNYDELVVGIPNSELSGQRIYNLSRTPRSQVKQELRVSYDDVGKIPKLLDAIKEEIRKDCPELITDGSRPFRAHWRNYERDHLQIVVDCHFRIKPIGNEYWDNRQKVLEAIHRGAKKTGVQFETSQECLIKHSG